MKHSSPDRVFTEVNEGNQELAGSSLPSRTSVRRQGLDLFVLAGCVEREHFEQSVERIAAGGRFSQLPTPLAAAIAHFCRSAACAPRLIQVA